MLRVGAWSSCKSLYVHDMLSMGPEKRLRVGIVGSRKFSDPVAVWLWMEANIKPGDVVVSGGAHGPDAWAANIAFYVLGLPSESVRVHRADWEGLGKRAGFERNTTIVEDCETLVAFYDGSSKGTKDTMGKARLMGLGLTCLFPRPRIRNLFYVDLAIHERKPCQSR